ncbi:Yippee zinc-binding/DNA-binding /Mis18, centromere assembly [Popillia japonica]|uniref:Protein cereblon n=1 Tax=Popillia japonica TaxID=7064 RepID=A0AAW1MQ75_POPJA
MAKCQKKVTVDRDFAIMLDIDDNPESDGSGEFDKSLPAAHRYLGKLDNVGGYTIFDEGQVIPGMLAIHTNTLVFPGFTLPLVLRDFETDQLLEDIKKGYMFVLISTGKVKTKLYEYGVIMEVYETSARRGVINLKAKGRQRCKILPGTMSRNPWARMQKLTVEILGEPNIKSPISNSQLQTLRARRTNFGSDYKSLMRNYKYRRYHLSQYPYASWVYDHNELSYLVELITDNLAKFYVKEHLPQDPTSLSYWFVQNYQLTHEERLDILKCPSVLERLRLELRYLNMKRSLICGRCSIEIANQSDVFAMSREGMQSNYCNPGGQVYETITVSEAQNYTTVGEPSKQFTWFPGYAWTIIQCKCCTGHLGWLFTSNNHQPERFFGLAHSCLDIKKIKIKNDSDSNATEGDESKQMQVS